MRHIVALVALALVLAWANSLTALGGDLQTQLPFDASMVAACIRVMDQGEIPWQYVRVPTICFYPPIGYEVLLRPWLWLWGPPLVFTFVLGFGAWLRYSIGSWRRTWPMLLSGHLLYSLFVEGNPLLLILPLSLALPAVPLIGPLALATGVAIKPTLGALFCLYWLPYYWMQRRRDLAIFVVTVIALSVLGVLLTTWRFGGWQWLPAMRNAMTVRAVQDGCAQWTAGAPLTNLPCTLLGLPPLIGTLIGVVAWAALLLINLRRAAGGASVESLRLPTTLLGTLFAPQVSQPALPTMVQMPFYQQWRGTLYSWAVLLLCMGLPLILAAHEGIGSNLSDNLYIGAMVPLLLLPSLPAAWRWLRGGGVMG